MKPNNCFVWGEGGGGFFLKKRMTPKMIHDDTAIFYTEKDIGSAMTLLISFTLCTKMRMAIEIQIKGPRAKQSNYGFVELHSRGHL